MTPQLVTRTPLAHLRWDGGGAPVLLMHGVGGGREAWSDVCMGPGAGTGVALAAAGFTALAVDFPGYGLSAPVEPYDLAGMAGAVIATLEALAAGPAILVTPITEPAFRSP